jgi:hypothetical protein
MDITLEISLIYVLSHRSTLYWFVAMVLLYYSSIVYSFVAMNQSHHGGMDPHCIFGGHILNQCFHGYKVYWSVAMLWFNLF